MKYTILAILLTISGSVLAENRVMVVDCDSFFGYASEKGVQVPVEISNKIVSGNEPLHLYSAPSEHCIEESLSVKVSEELVAMRTFNEFTMIVYRVPESGVELTKWVPTNRLKQGQLIDTKPNIYQGEPYAID